MKRPLFRAATAFVLGEVAGICLSGIWQISIAIVMLIFGVCMSVRLKRYRFFYILSAVCFMLGEANILLRKPVSVDENKCACFCGYVDDISRNEDDAVCYVKTDMDGKPRLIVYGVTGDVEIGDHVYVEGSVHGLEAATNPGQFDISVYYRARNVDGTVNNVSVFRKAQLSASCCVPGRVEVLFYNYTRIMRDLREFLTDRLYACFDYDTAAMYAGILLGDKQGIGDTIKDLYQVGGISHILAISGLHVSLLGMCFMRLLRFVGVRPAWSMLLSAAFVMFYGGLVGWGFATLRAVIMLMLGYGSGILGESSDMLTSAALALIVMLLREPYRILDGGLILSFTAIFGVASGQYAVKRLCKLKKIMRLKKKSRRLYGVFSSLVMSVVLQLIMAPVLVIMYSEYPVYSILINLIALPFMPVILVSGVGGLAFSFFDIHMAGVVIMAGRIILKFYLTLCEFALTLPYHTVCIGKPGYHTVLLYYSFVLLLWLMSRSGLYEYIRIQLYEKTHIWHTVGYWHRVIFAAYISVIITGIGVVYIVHTNSLHEQIVFLDVGQGDGSIIRTANRTSIVIDGGSLTEKCVGEYILEPALKSQAMSEVDYWFVTHTDEDHISGLEEILIEGPLSGIDIGCLVLAENGVTDAATHDLIQLAQSRGINVVYMGAGDAISDGDTFTITCLHPSSDYVTEDKNSASLALAYVSDNVSVLFTGDMDTQAIQFMLEHYDYDFDAGFDIIKVPHHGSRYSCAAKLYEHTSLAVISCGRDNSYGHPHSEVTGTISESGADILVTSEVGAVKVVFE